MFHLLLMHHVKHPAIFECLAPSARRYHSHAIGNTNMASCGTAEVQVAAGAPGVSGSNHGSAAVAPATAALPQSAGVAMMTVPPAGMVGAATATEHARARGVQHLGSPDSAGFRHASPSALGAELSDDSLTMSPEEQRTQKRGGHKARRTRSHALGQALGTVAASPYATRFSVDARRA